MYKIKNSPYALIIEGSKIIIDKTIALDRMNDEISKINMMMSIDVPPKKTLIRIIGDSPNPLSLSAVAVFVDNKPELQYQVKIGKRSSIQMLFNGEDASVYSALFGTV